MELHKSWNEHLRREAQKRSKPRVRCPECGHGFLSTDIRDGIIALLPAFEKHYSDSHASLLSGNPQEADKSEILKAQWENAKQLLSSELEYSKAHAVAQGAQRDADRQMASPSPGAAAAAAAAAAGCKNKSPSHNFNNKPNSRSRSVSPPKRKTRPVPAVVDDNRAEFDRGTYKRKLWSPDEIAAPRARPDKSNIASHQRQRPSSVSSEKSRRQPHSSPAHSLDFQAPEDDPTKLIKQPETQFISQVQLVAEVKSIYAGLVMVERKCIEVDSSQNSHSDPTKLKSDQWQSLIALHRTLLHEHHDFFLASQHPSASQALRRLPTKYTMPARMWRHGIHSFLELSRHRVPANRDYMRTSIYLAYSIIALLYETVPAFEETWIECLGDLSRYRMTIGDDDDVLDREVSATVCQGWYPQPPDKDPELRRLYHRLANLARPSTWQQLFYYLKSLCVNIPFASARESIMTLFELLMSSMPTPQQKRLQPAELKFAHANLFSERHLEELEPDLEFFCHRLDPYSTYLTKRFCPAEIPQGSSGLRSSGFSLPSGDYLESIRDLFKPSHKGMPVNATSDLTQQDEILFYCHGISNQKKNLSIGVDPWIDSVPATQGSFGRAQNDLSAVLVASHLGLVGSVQSGNNLNPSVPDSLQRVARKFRFLIPPIILTLLPLTTAAPAQQIPYRAAKVILTSLSALSSLSTGMIALQLPPDPSSPNSRSSTEASSDAAADSQQLNGLTAKMALRIACTALFVLFVVAYTLFFLNLAGREARRKKRAFTVGSLACSLFCWIFVRPSLSAMDGREIGDEFGWLDGVNLFGLISALMGTLNAESSLFSALFSSSSSSPSAASDADEEEDRRGREADNFLRDEDEEEGRWHGRRRRRAVDDEENQSPGAGRQADRVDTIADIGDVGLTVMSLMSHAIGA